MKPICILLAVSLVAAPGTLCAQDPATPAPAPAPTAAPEAQAAPLAPVASTPPRILYEKVNIVVDGKAEYAGNIQLAIEPDGRTAKLVSVNILAKEKEKKIAEQIHREVAIALGADYKVKLSGNEIRISKANKKFSNVAIVIKQLELPGVSVRVERG